MNGLRRVLYWEAALWAVSGLALALVPKFLLERLFEQAPAPEYAWVRIAGIQAIGLAMLMVLVGQGVESRWWWAWTFAIVSAGVTTLSVVNAAFGIHGGSSPTFWWVLAAVLLGATGALLWGLARAGVERPPDLNPDD